MCHDDNCESLAIKLMVSLYLLLPGSRVSTSLPYTDGLAENKDGHQDVQLTSVDWVQLMRVFLFPRIFWTL